jgi:hypothetical protein
MARYVKARATRAIYAGEALSLLGWNWLTAQRGGKPYASPRAQWPANETKCGLCPLHSG